MDSSTFSKTHIQRPGLLFANCGSSACGNANYVYIAFSMMDGNSPPYPNGAVFGYNVSNLGGSYFYFQTTLGQQQGSNGGGIWMGGAAPAFGPADATGKNWIYVTTANGTWDGSTNWGDSFLKLDPYQLTVSATTSGFFTPADEWARQSPTCPANQAGDMDYGSGGPMLLPDNELTNWAHLAVNGDKEGGLWFVNRTTPGGINSCAQNSCYLPLCVHAPPTNVETYFTGTRTIHTSAAYWDSDSTDPALSYMYVAAIGGQLTQYTLCGEAAATAPIDYTNCPGAPIGSTNGNGPVYFSFGTTPAVSASGPAASDALVWAIDKTDGNLAQGTENGILHAFDALSMKELYSSNTCTGDAIYPATKRSVPTVANGYVYVGAQQTSGCPGPNCVNTGGGSFYIFGLNRQCS